jgi:twitching motility protein PilT
MKIADLLNLSVERGASDLHLTAGLPPLVRIDGEICPFSMSRWLDLREAANA